MGVFDLRVRLIPDSRELQKAIRGSQRDAIGRSAKGSAIGTGIAAGVGAGVGKGIKVTGFGKMLAALFGINAFVSAIRPLLEPVLKLLSAIMLLFFVPLIPLLKPFLTIMAEKVKALLPVMQEIADKVAASFEGGGFAAGFETFIKEITPVLISGLETLLTTFVPVAIPILVDGFITFIDELVKPANVDKIGSAMIEGFKNLMLGLVEIVKENWKEILIGFITVLLVGVIGGLIALLAGLTLGWAVAIGAAIVGALVFISVKLKELWPEIVEGIKSAWDNLTTGLKNIFEAIVSKVKGFLSIFGGSGGQSSNSESAGDFILRPGGGLIKTDPRDTLIGFRADKGGMGNLGGGGAITININNPVVRQTSDLKRMARELESILISNQRRRF